LSIAEAEISFLQLMIRHHEGGVFMAQGILETRQSVVKRLAESIVAAQSGEIEYMEGLLEKRGAERLEPLAPMNQDAMPGMNH
jgi:uncharacterized protein (DUF305 family)